MLFFRPQCLSILNSIQKNTQYFLTKWHRKSRFGENRSPPNIPVNDGKQCSTFWSSNYATEKENKNNRCHPTKRTQQHGRILTSPFSENTHNFNRTNILPPTFLFCILFHSCPFIWPNPFQIPTALTHFWKSQCDGVFCIRNHCSRRSPLEKKKKKVSIKYSLQSAVIFTTTTKVH